MKTKSAFLESIIEHKQILIAVTAVLTLLGVVALVEMPRDEFPQFAIRQGLIIGVYPGASSRQVEEQLTKKVEQYLFRYEAVDRAKTYSISKENVMVIYVEIDEREKDPEAFWAKFRLGLNELKGQLPAGVTSLVADNEFGNASALLLGVQSETKTYRELNEYVESFEDEVRKIPEVSRIKHFGQQNEVINVYIDNGKLARYGITPLAILSALKMEGSVNYAGEIDNGTRINPIHIPLRYKTESDVANQIVYHDPSGSVVRVKDIARVRREYKESDSYVRVDGKKCLIVSLEMRPGKNVVQFGKDVQRTIDKFSASLPSDVKIITISNMPDAVSRAIHNFMREFAISIVCVILVTVVLLPRRVALVAAATIPISILITLGFMWISGMDLQTVSLAGLIVVLGMVVDNAIIIIDHYVEKLDTGTAPRDAASQSVMDLFGSVFYATVIIIFCFVPMSMMQHGMVRDFVRSLPWTIGYALSVSLAVTALLLPLMNYTFIKHGIRSQKERGRKAAFLTGLQRAYEGAVEAAFRRRTVTMVIGVLASVIGIALLMLVPQEAFPKFERNQFAVEVYLPEGSSLGQTDAVIKDIESLLLKDPRVKVVSSFVGTSSPRFNTLYAPRFPARNYGQLVVLTESARATVDILNEYSGTYSNVYPRAYVRWKQLDMMPTDTPIEIRIAGDSIGTIEHVANRISDVVRPLRGIAWVRTDYGEPLQGVRIDMRQDEANRLGYSKALLAYSLAVGTKGFPISTVWEEDYPVDVVLKIDKSVKTSPDDVRNQYVLSPFFISSAPVRQLADIRPEWTEGEIVRRNGVRTITVKADVERGAYPAKILSRIKSKIGKMELSEGVSVAYGGEEEKKIQYMTPMFYSLLVSVAIAFLILLYRFRTVKRAFVIMAAMPLSLAGAGFGIAVTGYPFGITALVGLITLMGIVARNGIILVSYADELCAKQGFSAEQAAIAAGKRRMRPIFLTSAAMAVGVIPMILSGSSLWGPLGAVICFGVIFSMFLSLFVLPVLYAVTNKGAASGGA